MIDNQLSNLIKENRSKLKPIIETVIFLGRNGLPFRGHRDTSQYHPETGTYGEERVGLFIECLSLRVKAGDTVLENHLKTCAKNASYVSKTTQNDLIKCCGDVILKRLAADIKNARYFSILADEARDSSNQEQMSLVLRYFDATRLEAREEFMGFVHCSEGLTGKGLSNVILKKIKELDLDIMLCRGQGYDGAASMAGEKNGCASHILRVNSKLLFTHCFSHRLNLVVSKSCTIPLVRDMMSPIKNISYFFNASEKRQCHLAKNIETHCSESLKKNL